MLAPLQQQLRAILDLLPEAQDFALAGGGALIVQGVVSRPTRDLDYFGPSEEGVAPLADAFESLVTALGYTVERVQSFPGFVRFRVSTPEGETTTVDLGWDTRISPPERAGGGLVLAEAELAADKVLAVADRGEPRDYIDLAALVERHGFWKAYSTATEKQPGLDPRPLFYAFTYFGDIGRDRFPIPDASYAQLRDTVDGWRREVARRVCGPETDMRLASVGGPPSDLAVPPRLEFRPVTDDTSRGVTNPISVSVRPHQAGREWELAICGTAGAPLWVSDPYPTNEDAERARDFALRVTNSNYPLRIEGWNPGMPLAASYDPPPPEHAATTLRVLPPPHPSGGWRLQTTRPDQSVIITSSPYPDAAVAQTAAAFLGVLHVFAGDTTRTGQVRATPHPTGQTRKSQRPTPTPQRLHSSPPLSVHVRAYTHDDHGWEVATTRPDGLPHPLSGPHVTIAEAEQTRDFLVRLLNTHPQLHILGTHPPPKSEPDVSSAAPPTDQAPTVGIYAPDRNGPWYVQCRNPDGTNNDTSPPYPTYHTAANVLDKLGQLNAATANYDIGHRAVTKPTSTTCRCSQTGWRCGHIEIERPQTDPPDRGHGLSL